MNAQHFVRNASGDRGDTMAEIFARTSDHSSNGDVAMTDAELLQHYIERERIIHAGQRTPGHYRLRDLGFIQEYPVSLRNLLIIATSAGRTALECRPAAYMGTHPTLWGYTPPASSEMPAHHGHAP
jgi:hypothetical protein